MSDIPLPISEPPETLEGWYVLVDVYSVASWQSLADGEESDVVSEAVDWLKSADEYPEGQTSLYSVLTQKGDLMFVHYRPTLEELNQLELSFRQTGLYELLIPSFSYLSVVELSMHELSALVRKKLADQKIIAGTDEYEEAFATEMAKQEKRVESRLYPQLDDHRYICFYPMSKRRGEQINWYMLSSAERREFMRGHGEIGHKYHQQVTQVISGSVGLDDWEWGVALYGDDPLLFKKLIYEMRFDPASALYAQFGPFYMGIHRHPDQLSSLLAGQLR